MDFACRPTADMSSGVQQDLEETNDPRVLDFDAGIADRADHNGEGDPLQ